MKKLILIAMCFISLQLSAQGNLQFNQVINLDYTSAISGISKVNLGSVTVPAGKTWKIESGTLYRDSGTSNIGEAVAANLAFNNILVCDNKTNNNPNGTNYPIWLSAGTYQVVMSQNVSSNLTYVFSISIIEFNIVP